MRGPRAHDLTNQVFSRLTVTARHEIRGRRRVYWMCACVCGSLKWVIADALKSGATQSCGCLNKEILREGKHGATRDGAHTPEYASWHSMKQRCENPSNDRYPRYGGRGISVCAEWAASFEQFLADMGSRPPNTSLERRENNEGYSPSNCEWATPRAQSRNTSRNRMYTHDGLTLCIADWCQRTGLPHATLHARLARWPVDRALTEANHNPRKKDAT